MNRLIVAASESDADMLYATGLFVPDPFIYLEHKGKRLAVLSDLEIDRGRRLAKVDRLLSYSVYIRKLVRSGVRTPRLADVVQAVLRDHRIRSVTVPRSFPVGLAQELTARNVRLRPVRGAFFPERLRKSPAEVRKIQKAAALTEEGMAMAMRCLRGARIGRDGFLYHGNAKLLAEDIRGTINATIASLGGVASHTIVACGNQGCDPHETGHGPLRSGRPIIIDIFPRDVKTGYWGDLTRTIVRGRASERVRHLYAAVLQAQESALAMIRSGVDGLKIHQQVNDIFLAEGYRTERKHGKMQGFFHGTGHGLGLEIHEGPRIGHISEILESGNVVTVEPGLYYRGLGGVRIEDVVVVQKQGARNLTRTPKFLEL